MKKVSLLFILMLASLIGFGQTVNIGDILCTDGSTVRPEQYASSGKTAEGIVFYVDGTRGQGWAVSLEFQAVNTHWVVSEHYGDMYDIPGLDNFEHSREAMYDLDGYNNTAIIRNAHGADWYPAAWSVDFDHGWYLPAAGQMRWLIAYLNEINASLAVVQGTMFVYDHPRWYWTSTERTEAHAVVISQTGGVGNYPKWNYIGEYEIGVRAIKTFTIQPQSHHIGEVVTTASGQEGVVYYVSPEDGTYWLVAMNDLPNTYIWGPNTDIADLYNYNANDQFVTLHGVHCGYDATSSMREVMGTSTQYASSHVDFDNGWHIPSVGQLSKLYAALPFIEAFLADNGGTTLSGDYYWASTECSSNNAWAINFGANLYNEGLLKDFNKTSQLRVRAVWSEPCSIEPPIPVPSLPDNILEGDCNAPLEGFEWGIREDWSSGDNIYCRINPLVGDLDDDGIPEIVCFDMMGNNPNQTAAKTINVYDGRDKYLKAQINVEGLVWAHGNGPYGLVKLPHREGLIVTACKDSKLYAYNISLANSGIPVWVSNESYNTGYNDFSVSIGFADFNGDGHPEVYVRNKIFNAETGVLLATAQGGSNQADSYSHNSHTNHNKLSCPLAFDICGDTRQELILGNEIYDVVITNPNGTTGNHVTLTKSIAPPNGIINDGHVQVADFNLDGHPDILISNRDSEGATGTVSVYVWDVFNNRTSLPIQLETHFTGKSVPLIADFDNDGFVELLIDCCHENDKGLRAYRFNPATNGFSFLWSLPIDEDSYSNTATLFDFNADGKNELIYTDNSYMRIYDLNTTPPTELSMINCGEISIMQVPIVADVDNDGSAEIVVTGKADGYMQANTMLKVFKSSTEPWRNARKVWNQYMYHVTNVNEDLTIPTYCFNTATVFTAPDSTIRRPYNNFLQQAGYITPDGEPYNPGGAIEIDVDGVTCSTFTFNGITYNEEGLYEQTIESEEGCDTLYKIMVTITDAYQMEFSETVCGEAYTWNGTTYTETGDYQQEFTSTDGCDSIVTLHLNVFDAYDIALDTTVCGSFVWTGHEYTQSGHYEQAFVTANGCDSVFRMDLTVWPYPEAIPAITGPQEIYVATDLVVGQYFYLIDSVPSATHYEWTLVGADWVMDTTGTLCSLLVTTPGTATLKVKAWNNCDYSEQEIIIHAGFHDVDDNQAIPVNVYPNPANDKVFIEAEDIVRVRLFNLFGQCLIEKVTEPCERLELSLQYYAASLYLIEIQTTKGTIRTKLKTNPQ
jgi:hypothetical protein